MTWSTRELADLAGVSLRAIRHWHGLGLLPEPSRRSNGYKQYTGQHLVLALRIKRLTGLGFTLEQVAALLDHTRVAASSHGRTPDMPSLADLSAELDVRIAELQRMHTEVDALLRQGGPPDLEPAAAAMYDALVGGQTTFDATRATDAEESVGGGTGAGSTGAGCQHDGAVDEQHARAARANRDVAIVLGHLAPNRYVDAIADLVAGIPSPLLSLEREVMRLPEDASPIEIARLATEIASQIGAFIADHSNSADNADLAADLANLTDLESQSPLDTSLVAELAFDSLNEAQRQVMTAVLATLDVPE